MPGTEGDCIHRLAWVRSPTGCIRGDSMNKLTFIAAIAVAAAGSAWADDITIDHSVFVSTKTRAEVKAELVQARADGSLALLTADFIPARPYASELTRQEVMADVRAHRDGLALAITGEDSGAFYMARAMQPAAAPVWMAKLSRVMR